MKRLDTYTFESLSNKGIQKLVDYLKSAEGLDDAKIDEYIKILSRHAKSSGIKQDDYATFFNNHGLSELNWGRKNSAIKQFVNLFSENDNLEALSHIVKNNGIISINDPKFTDNGNIFNYCKNDQYDFTDEAHTIATWTNSKSANAGPCEMLLKFILKEGATLESGDVGIKYSSKEEEMEVKAATTGKNASGGHAAGQRGNPNTNNKIRGAWSIYFYLNKNLLQIDPENSTADKSQYFQNENGVKKFNELLKERNLLNNTQIISDSIVDAICFQYDYITNENNSNNSLPTINDLKNSAREFTDKVINKNEGFTKQDLLNLVGCIQLYLYSQIEGFDYFFCIQIDKSDESKNPNNGNYWCVKKCKNRISPLLSFDNVVKNLYFGVLDSPTSSQGRTGKIYMKNLNKK